MRLSHQWIVPVALVGLLAAVWTAHFPPMGHLFSPQTNQGIYLYIGREILNGAAPYRDVFDNKGPLLYLLNALGLAVARGSFWGVYVVEYCLFALATVLGFYTLRRRFGILAASVAMLFFVLLLNRILLGDAEEEYIIPVQWVVLYLLTLTRRGAPSLRVYFAVGALGSLPLFLKPTEVGLWAALVVVELGLTLSARDLRSCSERLAAMVAGGLLGSAAFLVYLWSDGALHAFVDDYVLFNFSYTGANGWLSRFSSVLVGAGRLGDVTAAAVLVLWVFACRLAFLDWRGGSRDRFPYLAVAWWPLEIILSSVSGRQHWEFYLTWTVPMVLLVAIALSSAAARKRQLKGRQAARTSLAILVVVLVALAGTVGPLERHAHSLAGLLVHPKYWSSPPRDWYAVAQYIDAHTASNDLVLMWGGYSANINFLAQRRSPTRFPAQMLLYSPTGDHNGHLVRSFLDDLTRHPPAMIVDTSPTYGGQAGTPPLNTLPGSWPPGTPATFRNQWRQVLAYVQSNYARSTTLPFYPHWIVYLRR